MFLLSNSPKAELSTAVKYARTCVTSNRVLTRKLLTNVYRKPDVGFNERTNGGTRNGGTRNGFLFSSLSPLSLVRVLEKQ